MPKWLEIIPVAVVLSGIGLTELYIVFLDLRKIDIKPKKGEPRLTKESQDIP